MENIQGHYNPYNDVEENSGVGSAIFTQVKNIIAVGAVGAIARKAFSLANSSAGKYIKNNSAKFGNFGKNISSMSNPTLTGGFSNSQLGKKLLNKYTTSTQSFRSARLERSSYLSRLSRKNPNLAQARTVPSLFKNAKTFVGTAGHFWKKNVLAGSLISYGVDTSLGFTRDMGVEGSWYNPTTYAKWLGYDTLYSGGFSALKPLLKQARGSTVSGLKNIFKGKLGKTIAKGLESISPSTIRNEGNKNLFGSRVTDEAKTLYEKHFVYKAASHLNAFGETVKETANQLNRAHKEWSGHFSRSKQEIGLVNKIVSFAKPYASALRNIKSTYKENIRYKPTNDATTNAGLSVFESLRGISNRYKKEGTKAQIDLTEVNAMMKQELGVLNNKRNVFADILGLRKAKVEDYVSPKHAEDLVNDLSEVFPRSHVEELVTTVMKSQAFKGGYIAGKNVKGGGVNLSAFDPLVMIKRATLGILNTKWHIPFSNKTLSPGDLIGANTSLSEPVSVEFFKNKPQFALGKGHSVRNRPSTEFKSSIGDFAESADDGFLYINGKWAAFKGSSVDVIDTNRELRFSYHDSIYKRNEKLEILRADPEKWELYKSARDANKVKHTSNNKIYNAFLNFTNKAQLGIPGSIKEYMGKLTNFLEKGNNRYLAASKEMFDGAAPSFDSMNDGLALIERVHSSAIQDVSHILRNKDSLQVLADHIHASKLGDGGLEKILSSHGLHERFANLGITNADMFERIVQKPGLKEAVDLARINPKQSTRHVKTQALGGFSEITNDDLLRTSYIEDIFTQDFFAHGGKKEHGLISAAEDLKNKGLITDREYASMRVHAQTSVFLDNPAVRLRSDHSVGNEQKVKDLLKDAFTLAKQRNWNVHNEVMKFIDKNTSFRANLPRKHGSLDQMDAPFIPVNDTPYTSVYNMKKDPVSWMGQVLNERFTSVFNILDQTTPFQRDPVKYFGIRGSLNYIGTRALQVAGATLAYRAVDTALAVNPLLNQTMFDNGVTGVLADNAAKVRLGTSRVLDFIGVTGVAKHLEGLMPGFTTSAPGAILGGIVSKRLTGNTLPGFVYGAIGNRILSPLMPDFTKTYDQLKAEYSGEAEVPIMKSPMWLLGSTPWEGSKVIGWQPNWYQRATSRWESSDTLYGSELKSLIHKPIFPLGISIGDVINPYELERQHYYDRPYPVTSDFGSEIPIIGPAVASTIGRFIKNKKIMHAEFLKGEMVQDDGTYNMAITPPTLEEGRNLIHTTPGVRRTAGVASNFGNFSYMPSKMYGQAIAEDVLGNFSEFAGLKGFIGRSISKRFMNEPVTLPTLESAGRMASMGRSYENLNLGGLGIYTEGIRRFINKNNNREKSSINNIPNLMPEWLPEKLRRGDPYSSMLSGELRLPGSAYLRTHNAKFTLPATINMMGEAVGEIEAHYVKTKNGLKEQVNRNYEDDSVFKKSVQSVLSDAGLLIASNKLIYNKELDISGHADAIVQGDSGREVIQIKAIDSKQFNNLKGPLRRHQSQVNFILKETGMQNGTVFYVNRDDPNQTKSFKVNYSDELLRKDITNLTSARSRAYSKISNNKELAVGAAYSWVDRLKILADVAPTSKEFKEAHIIVKRQIKDGELDQKDIEKYNLAIKHKDAIIRKYELHPLRFKGKVLSPDTEHNIQSLNEDEMAAAEYSLVERAIGSAWESFTNANTIVTNKFFNYKDPLEHYKTYKLYGKEYKPWDDIYGSWIEPASREIISSEDAFGGFTKSYFYSRLIGGGGVGVMAGLAGSLYGSAHGVIRAATNTAYLPDSVEDQRNIELYFDKLKFARGKMMSELTSGYEQKIHQKNTRSTLTYLSGASNVDVGDIFRATPYMEKPYIESFLNTTNKNEREKILRMVPKELGATLRNYWLKNDQKDTTREFVENTSNPTYDLPDFTDQELDPSVNLEDIKFKTVSEMGLNAHDFGLGWSPQLLRMQQNMDDIQASDIGKESVTTSDTINLPELRLKINNILFRHGLKGSVRITSNNFSSSENSIDVRVYRNRTSSIVNAISNRMELING